MKLLSIVTSAVVMGSALGFAPSAKIHSVSTLKAAASEEFYIDQDRRNLMNLILVGSATVTVGGLGIPFISFFLPPIAGGGAGGITAKDALGNDLVAKDYLASKLAGDRSLAQGLKGDATYVYSFAFISDD
jgi:cytochrome b6-f complex iron-sulfur subunit